MFIYISPFETAAPTLVPKSVAKIKKNITPPKTAQETDRIIVFFSIKKTSLVGNAIIDGKTKKTILNINEKRIVSCGKNITAE